MTTYEGSGTKPSAANLNTRLAMTTIAIPKTKKKPFPKRGFAAKFSPPRSRHEDFIKEIAGWKPKHILTAMAAVNGIVYGVASKADAISYSMGAEGRVYSVDSKKLDRLARTGCNVFKTSIEGLRAFVSRNWGGITLSSANSIRKVRESLKRLKLINPVEMRKQQFFWSVFLDVDFAGLLAFYELLEDTLLNYWHVSFDVLPEHKGAMVRRLYNAIKGFMGKLYCRKLPEGVVGRDVYGCEVYRKGYHLLPEDQQEQSPVLIPDQDGVLPELIADQPTQQEQPCQTLYPSPTSRCQTHKEQNLRKNTQEWHGLTLAVEMLPIADQ